MDKRLASVDSDEGLAQNLVKQAQQQTMEAAKHKRFHLQALRLTPLARHLSGARWVEQRSPTPASFCGLVQ